MKPQFTQDELRNLNTLLSVTPITGKEAIAVAMLQQKIRGLIAGSVNTEKSKETPVSTPEEEPKK